MHIVTGNSEGRASDPLILDGLASSSGETDVQAASEGSNLIQNEIPLHNSGVHWTTPFNIIGLFILGVLSALAHHLYYDSLHHQSPTEESQEWAVRIGTALAFLVKMCFCASAAMAYRQYYWTILRSRHLTIQGIDNIMGLLSDPSCVASVDVLQNAFSCILIALVIWCIPLSAIVPPASLSVGIWTSIDTQAEGVPLVNWASLSHDQMANGAGVDDTFGGATQGTYRTVTASIYGILCTTRNSKLDMLAEGHCLGSQPLSDDLGSKRLRYGLLKTDNEGAQMRHAGFGTTGSVITLKKGMRQIK